MSEAYGYTCERCGETVTMTPVEYDDMLLAKERRSWRGPLRMTPVKILCSACLARPLARKRAKPRIVNPRRSLPKSAGLNLRPNERVDYGVIVTCREQDTQEVRSFAEKGSVTKALGDLADKLDSADGNWRIVSVCTPATIYGDLQGARDMVDSPPEVVLLGKIRRHDLLEKPPRGRRR